MIRDEEHIGALDGLRSAAIVLVLLYHLSPEHESDLGLRALPFKIADLGWSGVDLFFVLSGFLITGKLLAAKNEPHRFRNFYARRALRPLHAPPDSQSTPARRRLDIGQCAPHSAQ